MTQEALPQNLLEYVKNMHAQGFGEPEIRDALHFAGWSDQSVQGVFSYLFSPIHSPAMPLSAGETPLLVPVSHTVITQKNYPITILWAFKSTLIVVVLSLVLLLFGYYSLELLFIFPFTLIHDPLRRVRFSYAIDDEGISVFDGKSFEKAKRKKRFLYSNITQVEVTRDIADMALGLGTLRVSTGDVQKNGGGIFGTFKTASFAKANRCPFMFGTLVNADKCAVIDICGLKHANACILEQVLNTRIREMKTIKESTISEPYAS